MGGKMSHTYRFSISIGSCCARALQANLEKDFRKKDYQIRVSAARQCVQIKVPSESNYRPALYKHFLKAIQKRGYECQDPWIPHWIQGGLGILFGVAVLILCLFAPVLPFGVMIGVGLASSLCTLYFCYQAVKRAWSAMKASRSLTMDTLFALSTLVAVGVSVASLFVPWLPMMFEVGLFIFGFRHIGLAIQSTMHKKLEKEESLRGLAARTVLVFRNGKWIEAQVAKIRVGERIKVLANQMIPLDGIVLTENAHGIPLSGQFTSKRLELNTEVLAGTQLSANTSSLEIEVLREESKSYLASMDEFVEHAWEKKSPIEEKSDRILFYFVPIVILIALLSGLLVGFLVGAGFGISCAVAVLVSACPCTLGLIVPLAVKVGVEKAARHGLAFASGEALERAKDIDAVAFDITGTLTEGKFSVQAMTWLGDKDKETELKKLLWAMETAAMQMKKIPENCSVCVPIASAVSDAFRDFATPTETFTDVWGGLNLQAIPGGLSAHHSGKTWYVGNATLMKERGFTLPFSKPLKMGQHEIWMACEGEDVLGRMLIYDALRPEAAETIERLRQQKKEIYVITGSPQAAAYSYTDFLGIPRDCVFADCVPIHLPNSPISDRLSKVQCLEKIKGSGPHKKKVAMVGEGLNDTPVVTKSDLGIAILSPGTSPTTEANAQVHLSGSSLLPLQYLFPIATNCSHWILVSLGLSLGYNLISVLLASGILLAAGVVLNPVIGAILMVAQMAILLLGAYFIHRRPMTLPPLETTAPTISSYNVMVESGLQEDATCTMQQTSPQSVPMSDFDLSHSNVIIQNKSPLQTEGLVV
jgi:P-type Cu2+ transporter